MSIISSTVLFKFNNFDTTRGNEIFPDEVSDFTTGEGKWKDVAVSGNVYHGHTTPALDKEGIEWRIRLKIHYFFTSDGEVSPNISRHEPELTLMRNVKGRAAIYERVSYSSESLAFIKLHTGGIIEWPAHKRLPYGDHRRESIWKARTGGPWSVSTNKGVGFTREQLLNEVEPDGSLIVKVEISNHIADSCFGLPRSPFVGNALKFLESGKSADVFFTIGDETIPAHMLILQMQASFLAGFFSNGSTVPIEGCNADVFRVLLSYVYGDNSPDPAFLLQRNEEVITAANKCNIVGLKLAAESVKVKYFAINESNVVQNLIFAEQMNCAIIKEICITILVAGFDSIIGSESFRDLLGSADLIQELMIELRNADPPSNGTFRGGRLTRTWTDDYNVNQLLNLCMDLDLDYDGTKEMLLSRVEEYYSRDEGEEDESSEQEEEDDSTEQEEED